MTYQIRGSIILEEHEMRDVYEAYRIGCIAEQIMMETDVHEDEARSLARRVIEHMDNNNMSENDAMEVVLCNLYF